MKKMYDNYDFLYKAIMSLKNEDECKAFFDDLCTPQELNAMCQRLHVASMLSDGYIYNDIVDETGASTATISRVNKTLNYQTAGGYKMIFDCIKDKK